MVGGAGPIPGPSTRTKPKARRRRFTARSLVGETGPCQALRLCYLERYPRCPGVLISAGGFSVSKKRTKEAVAHETATKVAEGIGEALARMVNRLESLDTERERAYKQLLGLQERLNAQVARFGRAIGRTVTTASAGRGRLRGRPGKKVRGGAAKSRSNATRKSPTAQSRKKGRIKCGICGTPGHNARGHAKWQASQPE